MRTGAKNQHFNYAIFVIDSAFNVFYWLIKGNFIVQIYCIVPRFTNVISLRTEMKFFIGYKNIVINIFHIFVFLLRSCPACVASCLAHKSFYALLRHTCI